MIKGGIYMLYNDYRPITLNEVRGQKRIVEAIGFQSVKRRFAHAYLFHGHRGTGKTTIARILARAVSCMQPNQNGPCMICDSCKNMFDSIDYLELDGASNNGVEQIKELVNRTKFLPVNMKKKVFVIDEVHMLSTAAFNALLKTLEEPPEHCIFILCTTELHKIPATVRSRCETHFFVAITIDEMVASMEAILSKKEIQYEREALQLIAESADGSLRDALSILGQIMVCQENGILTKTVRDRLNLIDRLIVERITMYLLEYQTIDALKLLQQIHEEGRSLRYMVDEMITFLSNVIISETTGKSMLGKLSKRPVIQRLFWIVEQFTNLRENMRAEADPFMVVYLLFIKMSNQEILWEDASYLSTQVAELRDRLLILEEKTGKGQNDESNALKSLNKEECENKGGVDITDSEPVEKNESAWKPDDTENPFSDKKDSEEDPFGDLFALM